MTSAQAARPSMARPRLLGLEGSTIAWAIRPAARFRTTKTALVKPYRLPIKVGAHRIRDGIDRGAPSQQRDGRRRPSIICLNPFGIQFWIDHWNAGRTIGSWKLQVEAVVLRVGDALGAIFEDAVAQFDLAIADVYQLRILEGREQEIAGAVH